MYHHKGTDATGAKVARRSQSTVARPQGVLDLMENSWYALVSSLGWTRVWPLAGSIRCDSEPYFQRCPDACLAGLLKDHALPASI